LAYDDDLARDLAAEAGRRLLALRAGGGSADDLRAAGDRLSHEFLAAELARLRPGDAVLSEEGRDDPARLSAGRVWIVDPLDGTKEFGEPGRADWAVHVALWDHGALTAGAVALPAQAAVLSTADTPLPAEASHPAGASSHGAAAPGTAEAAGTARSDGPCRLVVSRTRPPAFVGRLRETAGVTTVPLGSAGAKAAAVIRGEADGYVHSGGQYEWDSAAPVAVALAAGLHASRLDGSKLEYNQANPWLPDILICRAAIAGRLLDDIRAARRSCPE
jgi:3'(2'), 5'-bisphosphate nucleotidase